MKGRFQATVLLSLWLLACSTTPATYHPDKVPRLEEVGCAVYYGWFADQAVGPDTHKFINSHRPALEQVLTRLGALTKELPAVRIKTRKNPEDPNRPGLKEPCKVEEKIYRNWQDSNRHWDEVKVEGDEGKGDFPQGTSIATARKLVFFAPPEVPYALRDIAGLRIIAATLDEVFLIDKQMRQLFGKNIIRYKDFIHKQYRGNGYRSVHFVVVSGGKPVEIQVRTERQQRWASWEHDLTYKGPLKDCPVSSSYARAVADVLFMRDQNQCPSGCPLPKCPKRLQSEKHCFMEMDESKVVR